MTKKKYNPQLYMAAKRNNPSRKRQALKEARDIARFLTETYGAKVYGIGSLFDNERVFSNTSDIDLVVEGIPKNKFFSICAEAAELSQFSIDIIPYEDANELVRETVHERGVLL
jgi:predicted nucleotidyltransferase